VRLLAPLLLLALLSAVPARADSLSLDGTPSPAASFTLEETFVTVTGPITDFRWLPDERLVIVTKTGNVLVRPSAGGALVTAGGFSVDVESEKGLLGVAVHPSFGSNGQLFFYYSASDAAGGTDADRQRVVMRTLGADNLLSARETVLLAGLRGPANHDGGALDIGPDGLLYVGVGDTGCNSGTVPEPPYTPTNFYGTCLADDPQQHGGGNGKILRIGLDGSIPQTNPLVAATNVTACGASCGVPISTGMIGAPRGELFAWGFRNPFRLWVDPITNAVWVGDVGEVSYEEVTIVQPGRHHGWPWREGAKGHPLTKCRDVRIGTGAGGEPIFDGDCVDPAYYCRHANPALDPAVDPGCSSIIGGQIVDSCSWPAAFRGNYVFGDSSSGAVWLLTPTAARDAVTGVREDFATITGTPVAFHTGPDGALYVAVLGGRIVRIAPTSPEPCMSTTTFQTTTTTGAPSTTTTAPPGCDPTGTSPCDDGDACTTDTCGADGRCRHDARVGLGSVQCLCGVAPAACEGLRLPRSIASRFSRGCARVAGAGEVRSPKRAKKLVRQAAQAFRRGARQARRASLGRLGPACGPAVERLLLDAAARARSLVND
jgi:glucose/arabinose dehydrogenase